VPRLRRGIVGGVDHWSVCHGTEVGGGLARCDGMQGKMTALGVTPSLRPKPDAHRMYAHD
jgi:hypothetical protein